MKTVLKRMAMISALGAALLTAVTVAQAADKKFALKTKPYPLGVCPVSDEKLGSMGDPVVLVEGSQEIQLCCKSCKKDFEKNKEAHLKKIEAAWKKVKAYPATTCIVSDEPLDAEQAVGVVHEGREFVFCCKNCAKDFKKDTAKFVKKFDALAKK